MNEVDKELLGMAEQKLAGAKHLLKGGFRADAVSRAYYAAFHALSAVLSASGFSFSSHREVLSTFNKEFIMTGRMKAIRYRDIQRLFNDRQGGDYDPLLEVSETAAEEDITIAESILSECRRYLRSPRD
jgi:uncharacterized protein (UPF0332 family)